MGWSRKPSRFTDDVIQAVSKQARKDALCILGTLTAVSPVDTGRFKGNWIVSLRNPDSSTRELEDKGGAIVMGLGEAILRGHKGFEDIWISNNLPYASRLNDGHSQQAPRNFVQTAVLRCASK